jgi:hypothetical protein
MTNLTSSVNNAGSIAARVLSVWRSQPEGGLRKELELSQDLASQAPKPSTYETERMDVLLGAIEGLGSSRPERVRAALYVIEHLASVETSRPGNPQSK